MKKKLLVTGGSGTLGSEIIKKILEDDSYEVSTLSTNPAKHPFPENCRVFKGDLVTGEGLTDALKGVQLIIHCASSVTDPGQVDHNGTINLIAALDRSALENLVYVSIVGIDNTNHPYYMIKLKVEQLIAASDIPFSILRATQFHEYVIDFIRSLTTTEKEINVPTGLKFQTIAVPELAEVFIRMLSAKATGGIAYIGGPEIKGLEDMTAGYLRAACSKQHICLVEATQPRELRFRTGANLVQDAKYGKITWGRFLEKFKSELNLV